MNASMVWWPMQYREHNGLNQVLANQIGQEWVLSSDTSGIWVNLTDNLNWTQDSQKTLIKWVADQFPLFSDNQTLEKLPKLFLKNEISDRAIFFGGTFNPWHMGHRVSLDMCPVGPLIVVPDQNPWKEVQHRDNVWNYYLDICRKLEETNYSVYPGFLLLDIANPTIDWISQIKIVSKYLLIGEDSFLNIQKWKESDRLLKLLSGLFVSPRGEDSENVGKLRQDLKKIYPNLVVQFLDHHDYEDLSSTKLRKK